VRLARIAAEPAWRTRWRVIPVVLVEFPDADSAGAARNNTVLITG
jgi:hypothetical protein